MLDQEPNEIVEAAMRRTHQCSDTIAYVHQIAGAGATSQRRHGTIVIPKGAAAYLNTLSKRQAAAATFAAAKALRTGGPREFEVTLRIRSIAP
eukprot:SAG11_NODE_12450_length_702_cov_46.583748_2_plen_92_part_01